MTTFSNSSTLPTRNTQIFIVNVNIIKPVGKTDHKAKTIILRKKFQWTKAILQFLIAADLLASTVTNGDFRWGTVLMLYSLEQAYFFRTAWETKNQINHKPKKTALWAMLPGIYWRQQKQ